MRRAQRYGGSRVLLHLRQAALRQLHPRRPRSGLLRALSRSPFGGGCSGCRVCASAGCLSAGGNAGTGAKLRPKSHGRRHPGGIFSLRRRCRLLLAICQGTRTPADFRIAHFRLITPAIGMRCSASPSHSSTSTRSSMRCAPPALCRKASPRQIHSAWDRLSAWETKLNPKISPPLRLF